MSPPRREIAASGWRRAGLGQAAGNHNEPDDAGAVPSPAVELVWPAVEYLPSYIAALERGWSPNTVRPEAAAEELDRIAADPAAFLGSLVDRAASGEPIPLPDGSLGRRLPGFHKWMWDGELCGSIGFRWTPGTATLPEHVLGHIGYSVVPWKRRRGYATRALASMLDEVVGEGVGFDHVVLTTDVDNVASQRVVEANGGILVGRFPMPAVYGGSEGLRYRIDLPVN